MPELTRQIRIIHLSDIHFGSAHRFDPLPTPKGDLPTRLGFPTLLQKLQEALEGPDPGCPVFFCITGDVMTTAAFKESQEAEIFIKGLADLKAFGHARGIESVFVVPGNHDVSYASADVGERWQNWIELANRIYGSRIRREDPWALTQLHHRSRALGVIVLNINTAIHVQKGQPDEDRGHVDLLQLKAIEDSLERVPSVELETSIRIALMHHHPVLIPDLAESGRGYDAVHNSGRLLALLRRFGFHLVLHGHKHFPTVFTDDSRSAFTHGSWRPLLIVAGGSCGSRDLPDVPGKRNCFNDITVKWHPDADQTRIRVRTLGLETHNSDGTELLPERWRWRAMGAVDRAFLPESPAPSSEGIINQFDPSRANDKARVDIYAATRGNLAVVEVLPSLEPDQAYEARFWIVGHNRKEADIPQKVLWSAGPRFPTITVAGNDDATFLGRFDYWGPMLIQAELRFADGETALTYVYARIPERRT